MRIAFKINTFARLSLLFGLFWLALGAAAIFGWRSVSAEVEQRAKAEAGFAVATISQRLDESAGRYAGQGLAEVQALRLAAGRLGPPRIVQGTDGPVLTFGRGPHRGSLAEDVASRAGGVATIFVFQGGELVPVESSRENAAGAFGPGARIPAITGLPRLLRDGRSAAAPVRLAGRAYYTYLDPITDQSGATVGAYGASFPLESVDDITRQLARSPVFAGGFLAVADGRDNILFSSSDRVPTWLTDNLKIVNQGGDIEGATLNDYSITRSAPGKAGLRVIAGVRQRDLTLSTLKLVGTSLGFLGVVIALAMCLAWLLARRLTEALAEAERHRAEAEQARAAVEAADATLNAELEQAARYVESLLPERTKQGPVATDWLYRPSESIGGDAFGYHWLDETRFAFYLLDVCGHGVGAALLASTVMSVIRTETVKADFTNPSMVLGALNDEFPMEQQNGMYFTIWYGVYDTATKTARYAGGGHHPALLIAPSAEPQLLKGRGVPIGCFAGVEYQDFTVSIPDGAQLYVFSDGLFEVELKSCKDMLTFDAFVDIIVGWRQTRPDGELVNVLEAIQEIQGKPDFDDDCSLLELRFRPTGQVRLVA